MRSLTTRHVALAILIAFAFIAAGAIAGIKLGPQRLVVVSTLAMEAGFLVAAWVASRVARAPFKDALWLQSANVSHVCGSLLIGLGVMAFSTAIAGRYQRPDDFAGALRIMEDTRRAMGTLPLFLALGVFAPICEEIFFRGVVFQGLRKRLRTAGAVAVSAGFFGLMHGVGTHGLVALVLGLVCALAVVRSRRLVTSAMVHIANNLASLILWVALPSYVLPLPFAAVGIGLAAVGFMLLRSPTGVTPFAAVVAS
jgi:membrane protease YdiL (CAAX protease family)